ncbi:uncharacterized protein DS421_9g277620 [Arachis hypogaea]|nr:uncharacterized protein DS421_9g277620 [Arachis hypogaea]
MKHPAPFSSPLTETQIFLIPKPSKYPFHGNIKSILHSLQSIVTFGINQPWNILDHFLPHFPNLFLAVAFENRFYRGPILNRVPVYVNRVTTRFSRQEPLILKVSTPPPEKNRNRTCHHAIEDRTPREAVPSRLKAEIRLKKRLHDR